MGEVHFQCPTSFSFYAIFPNCTVSLNSQILVLPQVFFGGQEKAILTSSQGVQEFTLLFFQDCFHFKVV